MSSARTNKNVTLTAKFGSGSAKKQYSLNKKTWNTYKSGVKMTKNGTVYFRSLSSTGKVSKIVSYKVANIDKTPPKTPKALADITAKTVGGTVTVTASFSSDSVTKQYSTDGKTWQDYEGGIEFTVNGAIWFRGIDSVGNVSKAAKYSVTNIVTPMALATQVSGKVGYSGILTAELRPLLESPGLYKLTADFGSLNGALTVKTGKTTVASATIRKGKLTFKVGSTDLLLDSAKSYTIAITNSDKGKSKTDFTCTLAEQTLFEHPDRSTADDKWSAAPVLMAEEAINGGWVGFSDAIDYREFTGVAETGGLYKFDLTGATNKVKLTVYEVQTTKVKGKTTTSLNALKSVTATASASTGNLALSGSKRYIVAVAAVDAAKGKNSEYDLTTTKSGVFTGTGNNSIAKATKLAAEDELNGMLSKVSGGDTVDFYDLASVKGQSLNLTMDSGALKVTFCDKNGKAIKVASVTMADTVTVKKNISSLTLASGTATGSIAFMASASNLRYLKIEAPSGGVNAYRLAVQAVV